MSYRFGSNSIYYFNIQMNNYEKSETHAISKTKMSSRNMSEKQTIGRAASLDFDLKCTSKYDLFYFG